MRILTVGNMYPPHHLGGYELMWRSAVRHLRVAGHEVRVLTTDYRSPAPDSAIAEDSDVHRELRWYWRAHEIPRRGFREMLALERHNQEALSRHLAFRPDVISWWAMGGMSMSLIEQGRRLGVPAVGVVVDDWMTYGRVTDRWQRAFGRRRLLAGPIERFTGVPTRLQLGPGARWVFVSEYVRRHAAAHGVLPADTAIAHGGIDPGHFPPAAEQPWQGRLLYLGRLDERKGIETAIRALALLPDATLVIVGDGDREYAARLRAVVAELRLEDRVSFSQPGRDRVATIYTEADAVLFPVTWAEPWGLVPLEAMAVGRPVIATGTGGSAEYLRDGENCLLYAPHGEPSALAGAIERLAADASLRSRLVEGGRNTASRFTEARFNEAIESALVEVGG